MNDPHKKGKKLFIKTTDLDIVKLITNVSNCILK